MKRVIPILKDGTCSLAGDDIKYIIRIFQERKKPGSTHPLSLKHFYLLHILEEGVENFQACILTHWQNMSIVCALIGALDGTILLTGLQHSVGFKSSGLNHFVHINL
jgi:hypothetical protein